MKNLAKIAIIAAIWFAPFWLSIMSGCQEQQLERTDQIITDANDIVAAIRDLIQSPAGSFLPPDIRLYSAIGLALASIAYNVWQRLRGNLMKKTTTAIVQGIEKTERSGQGPNPASLVKTVIEQEMKAAGIYDKGNKIVDRLKIA